MKSIIILVSALLLSFTTSSDNVIDRLGVKGPVIYNKTKFNLAWSAKPSKTYYVQEYLPDSQKYESFHQMFTINLFDIDIKLTDAVQQKVKELEARKKTDPSCTFTVTKSPNGNEYMVDFLVSERKNGKMIIAEFNVYRYIKIDLSKGKQAILVMAYSKRAYGKETRNFIMNIALSRLKYMQKMTEVPIPKITLSAS